MIVVPMAGMSRRFVEAGYTEPKYKLRAHGRSVFALSVGSFRSYFNSETFLFIVRDIADTLEFVRAECVALGIRRVHVEVLDAPTAGQAETVDLGLELDQTDESEPLTIFNIDTFRPGFRQPDFAGRRTDGYLEVFRGSGENWSYVGPAAPDSDLVTETTEKQPISDLCCTGLYYFASARLFRQAYRSFYHDFVSNQALKERYVAPIYNDMIRGGLAVRYTVVPVNTVIFCGVPAEYEAVRAMPADCFAAL